jgi:hypothetical protein
VKCNKNSRGDKLTLQPKYIWRNIQALNTMCCCYSWPLHYLIT